MILAIETSCDETAAAIVEKDGSGVRVRSSVVSSQIALHAPFGGVVPNLAAREHVKNIVPVVESAIREAHLLPSDMEAIAVTAGPGLMPALQIGVTAAKTLSFLWKKPLLPIHHIEGHIYANFINEQGSRGTGHDSKKDSSLNIEHCELNMDFPLLALVVSGGHTEIVLMRDHFDYEILGETEDDAVGEAFDKVAKMLGLPYPGGPEIAKRAALFGNDDRKTSKKESTPDSETKHAEIHSPFSIQHSSFSFPRPMKESGDYRFSFSGLKTSVLYFLKKHEGEKTDEPFINAVCHEFQEAALDVLVDKTRCAIEEYHPRTVIIAGGVSANTELRRRMSDMVSHDFPEAHFLMPPFKYSLDNAAMIGAAALFRWEHMESQEQALARTNWQTLVANPNMLLGN